jgi:hypothetical protein
MKASDLASLLIQNSQDIDRDVVIDITVMHNESPALTTRAKLVFQRAESEIRLLAEVELKDFPITLRYNQKALHNVHNLGTSSSDIHHHFPDELSP